MDKPVRVVFCLPGSSFSGKFLSCWTDLTATCLRNNIELMLSCRQSCNIYYVRNMCLGADVTRGAGQKPFNGQLDYDYLMWIDSDVLFSPQQFMQLLAHDRDIVSGLYRMEGGEAFATVQTWDEAYFLKNGCFEFLTPNDIADKKELIDVAYTGMGFMLVKNGVFESLDYPWFVPINQHIGTMVDFTMEDVSFCLRAREKGYTVWVDPQIIVGHEKKVVL